MTITERYFSWDDFLNYVDWQPANSPEHSHQLWDRAKWFRTESFEEAMNLARYGWTDELSKIKSVNFEAPDIRNNIQLWTQEYSVTGAHTDIGRYVIGIPDCMYFPKQIFHDDFHTSPRFVNIVVNVSCTWDTSFNEVFRRGVKVLETVKALEMQNIKTRVILLENTESERRDALYRIFINIKDYQDIFYLEKLIFPIAHPSFLRRLCFSAEEREPENIRDIFGFRKCQGYGIPSDFFEYTDKNTMYFGAVEHKEEDVQTWIQNIKNDDYKNYAGDSQFDRHLEQLKYEAAAPNVAHIAHTPVQVPVEQTDDTDGQNITQTQQMNHDTAEQFEQQQSQQNQGKNDVQQSEQNSGQNSGQQSQNDGQNSCGGCNGQKKQSFLPVHVKRYVPATIDKTRYVPATISKARYVPALMYKQQNILR